MPKPPGMVPYGADQTLYLVVDRLGREAGVDREIEVERTDLETIITELMSRTIQRPGPRCRVQHP